jgi:hypothetical protein
MNKKSDEQQHLTLTEISDLIWWHNHCNQRLTTGHTDMVRHLQYEAMTAVTLELRLGGVEYETLLNGEIKRVLKRR